MKLDSQIAFADQTWLKNFSCLNESTLWEMTLMKESCEFLWQRINANWQMGIGQELFPEDGIFKHVDLFLETAGNAVWSSCTKKSIYLLNQ